MNTMDKGMIHVPGRTEQMAWDATQNSSWFKMYELFTSGIFRLLFVDHGWPPVTETEERETAGEGETTI